MAHMNAHASEGTLKVYTDATSMLTDTIGAALTGGADLIETGLAGISRWYARAAQRRHLAELDDRLLSDIGIDRKMAETEVSKHFWTR